MSEGLRRAADDPRRAAVARERLARPWWRRLGSAGVEFGPVPAGSAQMVWSNMHLHMLADPQALLRRWHEALAVDGFLMFSCLGPDTLRELRELYAALGWRESGASQAEVAFFQASSMALALYGRDELAADAGVETRGDGFRDVALAYNVRERADVDITLEQARLAGATITKPARETLWGGYSGYFADPDGHLWEVAYNPGFPLAEDGSLLLPP